MQKGETMNPVPKPKREVLWCKGCEQHLSIDKFGKDGKTSAGVQKYKARCKKCYRTHATHSHNSMTGYGVLKEHVDKIKNRCTICGYDRLKRALEFHHREPKKKDGEVSTLMRKGVSLERLQEEIDKCVVLCNRCHREVHANLIEV